MNGTNFNLINWISLDYDYNELDSYLLELDCIIEFLELTFVVIGCYINELH